MNKCPDDIVITLAIRTPITKAHRGGFKDTKLDYMIYKILAEVTARSKIDPALIDDICLGNVSSPLMSSGPRVTEKQLTQVRDSRASAKLRAAAIRAGIPHTTGASSVNRFCSSGLKATQDIANQIAVGSIDIGVAVGAESMTTGGSYLEEPFDDEVLKSQESADIMQPMIQTAENLSEEFRVTREQQDQYAAESFRRAEVAQKNGWFLDEIIPICTTTVDSTTREIRQVTLSQDEGIRYNTTIQTLSKLRPALPEFGNRTTAGNASQVSDGGRSHSSGSSNKVLIWANSCSCPADETIQGH